MNFFEKIKQYALNKLILLNIKTPSHDWPKQKEEMFNSFKTGCTVDLSDIKPTQSPILILKNKDIPIDIPLTTKVPVLEVYEINSGVGEYPIKMQCAVDVIDSKTKTITEIAQQAHEVHETLIILTSVADEMAGHLNLYTWSAGPVMSKFPYFALIILLLVQISWKMFGNEDNIILGLQKIPRLYDLKDPYCKARNNYTGIIKQILAEQPDHPLHILIKSYPPGTDPDVVINQFTHFYMPATLRLMMQEGTLQQLLAVVNDISTAV